MAGRLRRARRIRCGLALESDRTVAAAFGPGFPGALWLRGLRVRGGAATLRVEVPAAATLSASGRRLRPASALPLAPGEISLRLGLSGAGRRALRKAGSRRLAVEVALIFMPFDGGDTVRTRKTVDFGAAGGRR